MYPKHFVRFWDVTISVLIDNAVAVYIVHCGLITPANGTKTTSCS